MFLMSVLAAIHRWTRYRNTIWQLSKLSDRSLADIGIPREEIAQVAWRES